MAIQTPTLLYLKHKDKDSFQRERGLVKIVCLGDSITGYNNSDELPSHVKIYATYPFFLQQRTCLKIADCGIAGATSEEGIFYVSRTIDLFPASKYFVIGFGTNDFGNKKTSKFILPNIIRIINTVIGSGKKPFLFNVPYTNPRFFKKGFKKIKKQRDEHNAELKKYCEEHSIPLTDICSKLKEEHFEDNLHPNPLGAEIIAQEVFKILF